MRMWMVDPKLMCRQHLLGEHVELHMLAGSIKRGKSIRGFIDKGLVETHNILDRHETLVAEILRRGYKHNSPLVFQIQFYIYSRGQVDRAKSLKELINRCPKCKERYEQKSS
jgi:hypothetical protein